MSRHSVKASRVFCLSSTMQSIKGAEGSPCFRWHPRWMNESHAIVTSCRHANMYKIISNTSKMQYRGSCCPFSNVCTACTVCTIHWFPRLPSEFNNACGFAQSCRLDLHSKEYFQRILDDRSVSRLLGMSRLRSFQTFCWPFLQFLPKCGLHVREQMLLQFNVVKGQGNPANPALAKASYFFSHM